MVNLKHLYDINLAMSILFYEALDLILNKMFIKLIVIFSNQ